jgi:hypothetical protein
MRIVRAAVMSLMWIGVVPRVSVAQVTSPFDSSPGPTSDERLDRVVPVATVSRVGDIAALDRARTVQDGRGEPFVLGAAALDLHDPVHAKVVFTMANATNAPILLDDVVIEEVRLCSVPDRNHPFAVPMIAGRAGGYHGTGELPAGQRIAVQIPIAPNCGVKGSNTLGILVGVHRPGPREFSSTPRPADNTEFHVTKELFFRVFDRLRAE